MIKKLFLFGSLLTSLLASSLIPGQQQQVGDDVKLKSMTGKNDIMNIDFVFNEKSITGKGKEKGRKKKPKKRDSSNSSSNDRTSRRSSSSSRTSRPPTASKPVNTGLVRQQEVVAGGNRHSRHTSKEDNADENDITVTGSIRRKPLFHT